MGRVLQLGSLAGTEKFRHHSQRQAVITSHVERCERDYERAALARGCRAAVRIVDALPSCETCPKNRELVAETQR
jgi:hypothetical protein